MPLKLDRAWIFPEPELPDAQALIAEGRKAAESVKVGRSTDARVGWIKHLTHPPQYPRQKCQMLPSFL